MFVSIFAKPFAQKTVKCMECDDLLTQLLEEGGSADARLTTSRRTNASNSAETVVSAAAGTVCSANINKQRARLAAQVSGGRKMTFKGHAVTPERIDAMEDAEIEELHARYEARLGRGDEQVAGLLSSAHVCEHGVDASTLPGSQSSWLTSNKTRSSVVLFRVPAVSYTTVTECT